jgi:hypothetical protein
VGVCATAAGTSPTHEAAAADGRFPNLFLPRMELSARRRAKCQSGSSAVGDTKLSAAMGSFGAG